MSCLCGHSEGDHAAGPDEDTRECMAEGCECPTYDWYGEPAQATRAPQPSIDLDNQPIPGVPLGFPDPWED